MLEYLFILFYFSQIFIITVRFYSSFLQFLMTTFRLSKQSPEIYNQLYSIFRAYDQRSRIYYAKIFSINKLQQYNLTEALEYNEEVLSDMEGIAFPENINKIITSIPNDGLFTFITEPYQINLQEYMRTTRISEFEALQIFDSILKATYSIYSNGYWHKNIRPEHFVKIGDSWKLDSLVYSEDISSCKGLQSEYTWDSSYQPPQAYEKNIQTFADQDFLPIVVWNLGSLLLDLFFSVHKLKNHDILKKYKGKKFSLEDIKVKKTDIFSKKLKLILAEMLHYDSRARMKLQDVFSNQYLSKQVASIFKKKHKNSLFGAVKIFTGGRSALSSAMLSKQQRDKGSKIMPINQTIKNTFEDLKASINKTYTREPRSLNQIQTDESLLERISIFSQLLKKRAFDTSLIRKTTQQFLKIEELLTNQELESAIRIYKSIIDKSELLSITGTKFSQIKYKDNSKQIILLSKYAVQISSFINLQNLVNDMNKNINSLGIDSNLYAKFQSSNQYKALKKIINRKLDQKQQQLSNLRKKINELPMDQKKILQEHEIKKFISADFKKQNFSEIKICYRKILKISYDTVTKQYNNNLSNEKLARLAMYIVYSLTIDKLYIYNMIEKNFSYYFQWAQQKSSSYIPINNFQKYIDEASIKTLVLHAKTVLERYFKL